MTDKKGYKILIVEDEDSIRDVYKEYLTGEGFIVEMSSDGEDALEKIKTFDFDAMLLDIMLPKTDGLEVLKRIKSDIHYKDKVVLLLTALGRDSVIKEGFELGADGYLIKDQENPDDVKKNILNALKKVGKWKEREIRLGYLGIK